LALVCVVVFAASGCGRSEEDKDDPSAQSRTERIAESRERVGPRRSRAPVNAEPARLMPGIGRPCDEASDFDHYFLGTSFEGLPLTSKGWRCSPPPRKVRDVHGTPVYFSPARVNAYTYIYGSCTPPRDPATGRFEGGCPPPLSVSSSPSCERPHSIVRRYGGGTQLRHTHIRIRGVPAALYTEGSRRKKWRSSRAMPR
jgi:hypothetical protein